MMKLDIMQAVIGTLNERGESALLDQLLASWAHDQGSARFFRASANFIAMFTQAGQRQVLRFAHAGERSVALIEAELEYLAHLAAQGVLVARPIAALSGRLIESVPTALGLFHAVAFEALAGQQFEISDLTPAQFASWGRALGGLHQAAQSYSQPGRPTWQDHLALVEQHLPDKEPAARATLAQLRHQLAQLPTERSSFGLIHYDFELDNLLWNDEQIGMIDFDGSAWYWFAADIAYALRDLFADSAEAVDLRSPSVHAFISGYRAVRPIAEQELAQIPLFLQLHHLVMFATLLRALDTGDQPDQLDWAAALRERIANKIQLYRAGFARFAA